jgi:hypothetical protein
MRVSLFLAAMLAIGLAASNRRLCQAGPTITIGASVPQGRQTPLERISHEPWDRLLREYVDQAGMVDYAAWKNSREDLASLDAYLNQLSAAAIAGDSPREAQLAFWINAYNAVTVKGILREYPTSSIRNHTARVFGYNIWKDLQLQVGGKAYSLEAMEHEVLRPMGEPRIHFAIVCASRGCPRLLDEAYVADRLDEQLTGNARAFFADPTKFTVDARSGVVEVSPILKWFATDFGRDTHAQLQTIAPYLPDAARQIVGRGGVRMLYLDYDWGINDKPR